MPHMIYMFSNEYASKVSCEMASTATVYSSTFQEINFDGLDIITSGMSDIAGLGKF